MRRAILFLLLVSVAMASSLERKIGDTRSQLRQTQKQIQGVNLKLSRLAKGIATLKRDLANIDTKLARLDEELSKANELYKNKKEAYERTKKMVEKLTHKRSSLKQKLLLLISKEFSKSLLMTSLRNPTEEDIYKEELLKAIQKREKSQIQSVGKAYSETIKKLKESKKRLAQLEKEIAGLLQKQKELKRLRSIKAKKMKRYLASKQKYDRTLQELAEQRKSLQATLRKLSLIKQERQRSSSSAKVKVKHYGQKSYKKIRTVRYRGPKTIPPLDKFIILKRYGTYRDPIYNIEIPNENVELKPLLPNAKVRNVLNGKVVLAKWTPHLKNVVIIKHDGGLYTIYAYLDKLAPYIKKGRKLKKGYTIGRVSTKLIFEVTKNNSHINPLDLIKVK